jgi:hypothetical protein
MYTKRCIIASVFSAWHGGVFLMKILHFPLALKPFDSWILLCFIPKHFCVLYEGSLHFLWVKKLMPDMGKDGRLGLGNARHFPSTLNLPLTIIKTPTGSLPFKRCNNVSM